jgi:ABC-type multidrug transport system fused ATPase/permease subunit
MVRKLFHFKEFLLQEERAVKLQPLSLDRSKIGSVELRSFSASWRKDGSNILEKINISINPGSLVALVGPVGSGKVKTTI